MIPRGRQIALLTGSRAGRTHGSDTSRPARVFSRGRGHPPQGLLRVVLPRRSTVHRPTLSAHASEANHLRECPGLAPGPPISVRRTT